MLTFYYEAIKRGDGVRGKIIKEIHVTYRSVSPDLKEYLEIHEGKADERENACVQDNIIIGIKGLVHVKSGARRAQFYSLFILLTCLL